MKRIISVILIWIVFANLYGWIFSAKVCRYEIRKEQKMRLLQGIPADQIEVIKVPNRIVDEKKQNDFLRVKEWEISYHGVMFDFFKEVREQDSTSFFGVTDHKENKLLAKLKNDLMHSSDIPLANSPVSRFYRQLSSMYFILENDLYAWIPEKEQMTFFYETRDILCLTIDPDVPPPKFIS